MVSILAESVARRTVPLEGKRSGCHRTDGWGEQKRQNCQANPTPPIPQGGPCGLQEQLAQCCESSAAPADTWAGSGRAHSAAGRTRERKLARCTASSASPSSSWDGGSVTSWQGWCRGSRPVGLVRVLPVPPPPASRGQAFTGQTRGAALPR